MRTAVAGSMAGKAVELVTLVLLATVVPRVLGPHEYGRFSVPLTIVTLGSLAMSLGGPTLMARFVPAAPEADRIALARAIGGRLARGRALQLATGGLLAAAAAVVAPNQFPPLVTALVVSALACSTAASLALQVLLGLGRTGPWAARFPLQNAVLVAAVLLLHSRWDGTGAVVAILASTVASLVFAAAVVRPILRETVNPVAIPDGALRFGAFHAAGAALGQFADRGGVVAVAVLGGTTVEIGYAALAIGLALGVSYAILQAFTVSLPHLQLEEVGRSDGAERALRRLASSFVAILAPVALVGAVLVDRVVPAVFGSDYSGAVSAFGPAIALVVLAPLNAFMIQVAALRIQPRVSLTKGLSAVVAFVLVAAVAVPAWSAAGATLAALAGSAVSAVVVLRLLPGAAGARLVATSFAGAGAVLALGAVVA